MSLGPQDVLLPEMAMVTVEPGMRFVGRTFEERCGAAAAGGFAGIGLSLASYRAARDGGSSDADLRAMLRAHDLVLSEIESIGMPGAGTDGFRADVAAILEMADALGGDHFFVVASEGPSVDEQVQLFGWLCDACAGQGLKVGIEFMDIPGVSGARDIRAAVEVVERAGRSNGGLMVDSYHWFNGPNDWSDLEALPGNRVMGIQISDGGIPRVADNYIEDTLHHRAPPGEGDFDLLRFVQTLDRIGSMMPWSVEVIDDDIQAMPAEDAGRRLGEATRHLLDKARALS